MAERQDRLNLLIVDDDPGIVSELETAVGDATLIFQFADTPNAISRTLDEGRIDLAVIHVHAGSHALLDPLVRALRNQSAAPPILALADPEPESAAAAAQVSMEGIARVDDPRNAARLIRERARLIATGREQTEALRQVSDIQERYNLLLESSREAIAYLHEGLHIYANPSYLEQFGYAGFDELEGFSILDLLPAANDGTDLKTLLRALSKGEIPDAPIDVQAQRADGSEFRARADFSPARYDGEACTQIMIREQVALGDSEELQQELEKLRSRDLVTGLMNRQAFIATLSEVTASIDDDTHVAVLLVAIDDYASLQKKVGAAASDQIIKQMAELFGEVVDEGLYPARLSDHVLALCQCTADRGDTVALATRLVEHFSGKILEIGGKSPTITVSVGLSLGTGQMFSGDELLAQAQGALHEAERTGGNCYVRYRPSAEAADGDDLAQWSERLRHALNNREFRLIHLPITSMEDDEFRIIETEARLRVEGSDEVILPSAFRAAAVKTGLATDLDRDLLERVIGGEGMDDDDADVLVGLSLPSITEETFCDWLQERIESGQMPGQRLIVGVREPEIRESLREVQRFANRFVARGVRLALLGVELETRIDMLLKNLSFDFIKLEGNLAGALGKGDAARAALEALTRDAKSHAVEVIAPPVENTADLAALWQFGITLVQDDFLRDE
ncbi:EAL domain-containing protein [Wenzhouxiangella sp. XN79A]|uniref:EAL domain-containing protein n=1 Tax=Wenzhouxiangella sp. XN79A TaxID=2724193 RepID=UPI00144A8520|nr:EAL domain-containing protein [Wenzhouxiangella sp. XN79A]NKI36015.1 EAL domain-containing protein [Wenzhouxiangella sp. XN79A]